MIALTPEQVAEEVSRIEDKKNWPLFPILPVKLIGQVKDSDGVLFEEDVKPVIYLDANPFALCAADLSPEGLRAELGRYKKLTFESFKAMVETGWVGD